MVIRLHVRHTGLLHILAGMHGVRAATDRRLVLIIWYNMLVIVSTLILHLLMLRHDGLLPAAQIVSSIAASIATAASELRRGRHLVAASHVGATALTLATVHHSSGFLVPSVGAIGVLTLH